MLQIRLCLQYSLILPVCMTTVVSCLWLLQLQIGSLKQREFILLRFWRLEVWSQFYWAKVKLLAVLIPSGSFRENSFSCFFLASRGDLHPLALDHFPASLQSLATIIFTKLSSQNIIFVLWGLLWLHLGPAQIMQDKLLISGSLSPYKVIVTRSRD